MQRVQHMTLYRASFSGSVWERTHFSELITEMKMGGNAVRVVLLQSHHGYRSVPETYELVCKTEQAKTSVAAAFIDAD